MDKNYQVVFTGQRQVEIQEVPMPVPNDTQVLVKTQVSQISTGTELTMLEMEVDPNSSWGQMKNVYPYYPGYSNIGVVVGGGKDVDPSYIGKRVLVPARHAQYYVWGAKDVIVLPDNVDADEAAFSTLAVVAMASIRAACIRPGEAAVVYGAGIVGQLVARLAKLAGATKVFVADLSDYRLSLLPDEPTYIKVNSGEVDVPKFIKEHNNGGLANVVFETTGNQNLVQSELYCLARRGRMIITSSPRGTSVVDFNFCSGMGISITAAHNGAIHPAVATWENPWTQYRDHQYFVELLEKGLISVKNLVSNKADYKDAIGMYDMLMADRTKAMAVHLYWEGDK